MFPSNVVRFYSTILERFSAYFTRVTHADKYLTGLEDIRTLVFIWWRTRGSNPSEILIANEANTPSIPVPQTKWCKEWDSNPRPLPSERSALIQLSYPCRWRPHKDSHLDLNLRGVVFYLLNYTGKKYFRCGKRRPLLSLQMRCAGLAPCFQTNLLPLLFTILCRLTSRRLSGPATGSRFLWLPIALLRHALSRLLRISSVTLRGYIYTKRKWLL